MERNNYKSRSHTLNSTHALVLADNPTRNALILFNTGANAAVFSLDGAGQITIAAGDHVAFLQRVPTNSIWASSASGSTLVSWEA